MLALFQNPALMGSLVTGSFALFILYGWLSADLPLLHIILLSLVVLLMISLLALPLTLCYVAVSVICMKKPSSFSSSNSLRVSKLRYRTNAQDEEDGEESAMEMSQRLVN